MIKELSNQKDITSRVELWKLLKQYLPSLVTNEPTERVTAHVWALLRDHGSLIADGFINTYLPEHFVIPVQEKVTEH